LYIYHGSGVVINGQTIESGNMIDINTSDNILIVLLLMLNNDNPL